MNNVFWKNFRRALWPAALGLLAGGVAFAWFGQGGIWLSFAVLGAVFVAASIVVARSRPANGGAAAPAGDPTLAALPKMAREIFEQLPDPLMLLDASGRVLFANRAMRDVIGIGAERKHVSSLLRTPLLLQAIARTASTGVSTTTEFIVPVPVERHYQAHAARTGGDPAVTTLLLHDLTTTKRTEQMRADFVANASHELRTPLAALSGFIDTLKGHAKDDAPARDRFLDIMTVEAGRMRRLIDDLLSLTRIELNEHVPPWGEVSLESVVREAAAALVPLAQSDKITLEISATEKLPPLAGERDELIQLFQNLMHNAIKYGRPGGHVWVTLSLSPTSGGRGADAMLIAAVRDDGEGIPPSAIPRLTERFYRVDVQRSRERGGTGLGLAIVKHIVNRHQGKLQIESKIGEGSTFTVYLPAMRARPQAPVASVTEMS
jgi:two-component system phosphate regulon sensor histidine kinase PhoR